MEQVEISQTELEQWVATSLLELQGEPLLAFTALAGDASFRRYFRAHTATGSYIAALAPPAQENNAGFVAAAGWLRAAAVPAPRVLGADLQRGFLLLSDLGDQVLLQRLNADNVDAYYALALAELLKMQHIPCLLHYIFTVGANYPEFSAFLQWFRQRLLPVIEQQRWYTPHL